MAVEPGSTTPCPWHSSHSMVLSKQMRELPSSQHSYPLTVPEPLLIDQELLRGHLSCRTGAHGSWGTEAPAHPPLGVLS